MTSIEDSVHEIMDSWKRILSLSEAGFLKGSAEARGVDPKQGSTRSGCAFAFISSAGDLPGKSGSVCGRPEIAAKCGRFMDSEHARVPGEEVGSLEMLDSMGQGRDEIWWRGQKKK